MTPNGATIVSAIAIALALLDLGARGFAILVIFAALFAAIEVGAATLTALRRAALVVLPLAGFMALVWVGIVGRAPTEIAADLPGSRGAAALHVAVISGRLFFVVAMLQLVALRFDDLTPMQFVRALALPQSVKRMLVLTMSLIETLRHAIDRAYVALIAAGALTRRPSLTNLANVWRLIQAVWLSAVTIALGRLKDKWPVEGTLDLLDRAVARRAPLSVVDKIWIPVACAAAVVLLVDVLRRLG
jgi:hypothetical protein